MVHRFFFIAPLICLASSGFAQTSGPSLAKCTCHFEENAPPDKEGAIAANATLCVQTLDKNRRWCDITIHCLRGNMGPDCHAASNPKQALPALYRSHVREVGDAGGPAAAVFMKSAERNGNAIYALAKDVDPELTACSDAYLSRGKQIEQHFKEVFSCAYDDQSRWLSVTFNEGEELVRFLFGPHE